MCDTAASRDARTREDTHLQAVARPAGLTPVLTGCLPQSELSPGCPPVIAADAVQEQPSTSVMRR